MKIRCYSCGTILKLVGKIGWCKVDKWWVDRPEEKRFEDGLLPEERK